MQVTKPPLGEHIFATPEPDDEELAVVARIDKMRKSLAHWVREPRRWTGLVRKLLVARAIQGSNSIEGYHVTDEDALAVMEDEEPMDASRETWLAVRGYRDAMTYILGLSDDPHFEYELGLIRSLHYMMIRHDPDKRPGRWRIADILVKKEDTGETVYEGPTDDIVADLMGHLVQQIRTEKDCPVLIRGAMAHLNMAMIHPFKDGNGRMARAVQTLVLAREGILAPEFSSLEEYLGKNQSEYYDILLQVGGGVWQPDRSSRPWVRFTLTAHHRQAQILQRRVREWERTWEGLESVATRFQLPDRAVGSLFNAAFGARVRNSSYRADADVSEYAAGRDLKTLVQANLLNPVGERRGRFYTATPMLANIRAKARGTRYPLVNPFTEPDENRPSLF